jgi:Skp family chaperone for outer membrane proteins
LTVKMMFMRYKGYYILLLISISMWMFAPLNVSARGIKVKIKGSEKINAPVVEEVNLYGESHALVIGINNYTQGWPILSGAVNDAKLIAAELRKKGFNVTLKTNLDSRTLEQTFKEFFILKGNNPQTRLFVWFAGHGHTLNGEGFLIPTDAPLPHKGAEFRLKALSMRRFGEYVRLAQSKHALAVFDSCFSGTIFDTQRSAPPPAITRATTFPVRQFLTSGDTDQKVSDDGRFRKLFIRAIRGEERADANQDGYVTGSELGLFLTDRVTNLTRSRQTPRYGKLRDEDYDRGDFVFLLASLSTVIEKPPFKPSKAHLYVNPEPKDARVRILNIRPSFIQGMALESGRYHVEVTANGYKTKTQWVTLEAGLVETLDIRLEVQSQIGTKIGLIDFQYILKNSAGAETATAIIKNLKKNMEENLKAKGAEIEENKKEFERLAPVISEKVRKEKISEINREIDDFKKLREKYRSDLKKIEKKLVRQLQKELYEIIQNIGNNEGYLLIREKKRPKNKKSIYTSNASESVIQNAIDNFPTGAVDISNEVIPLITGKYIEQQ